MTTQATPIYKGLEGVAFGESRISNLDGNLGTLEYRGYHIQDLAHRSSYEEITYLLWFGKLPTSTELADFSQKLASHRKVPAELISVLKGLPKDSAPIDVLRTAVSTFGMFDPKANDSNPDANLDKSYRLTASMSTLVAAWERIRNAREPIVPRTDLGTAANFLYLLTGKEADPSTIDAVNNNLVLLADHGMNASTFSARVVTSTLSDTYSAITSAIGALKGIAHGGAAEMVMRQIIEIGSPENVETWFHNTIRHRKRVMGVGHRVYKTGDPRMVIFKKQARDLAESSGKYIWYEIATRLEELTMTTPYFIERKLLPNVDYYSALTLYQSGIPIDQFTSVFAISRIAGWCAHIMEQSQNNRLIRPDIIYTGNRNQSFFPLEHRQD